MPMPTPTLTPTLTPTPLPQRQRQRQPQRPCPLALLPLLASLVAAAPERDSWSTTSVRVSVRGIGRGQAQGCLEVGL